MVQHLTAKTGGQAKALVATLLYTIPSQKVKSRVIGLRHRV